MDDSAVTNDLEPTDEQLDRLVGHVRNGNMAAFATEMVAASAGYTKDSIKGTDLFKTATKLDSDSEPELYDDYYTEYQNNDLAQFLVNHIVAALMDFELESVDLTKLEQVQTFFYANNTREHLSQIIMNSVVFGTGIAQRWGVGKRVDNFTRVDSSSIKIYKDGVDPKGHMRYLFEQQINTDLVGDTAPGVTPEVRTKPLDAKKIAMFRPIEVQKSPYGVSFMRSSLLPLQAIRQLNMDIPAGIKRLAYETMVLYLDLEGVPADKQKDEIRKAIKSFVKYDSATNTIVGLDKRHQLHYVGANGSGGMQKIVPILELLEPLLIFLLNKWNVPLSEVLQEKSNRALAQTQSATAYQRLNSLKAKFAHFVETQLIAHITGEVGLIPSVRVVHNVSFSEIKDELTFLLECYKVGAVPREYIQNKMGIQLPEGKLTYYMAGKSYLFDGKMDTTQDMAAPPEPQEPAAGGDSKPKPATPKEPKTE